MTADDKGNIIDRGECEDCGEDCDNYKEYVKADFDEWKKYWNQTELPSDFDVLDLAFFYSDGDYVEAEEDWRKEVAVSLLQTRYEDGPCQN